MRAIANGLQIRENYFDAMFADPSAWLAMLHYPPHPREDDSLGVGEHTDHEVLTMVLQDDVGGLEVKTDDGRWVEVPPIPGSSIKKIIYSLTHLKIILGGRVRICNKEKYKYELL